MINKTVERFTADLKTVSRFNITEHSVFLNSMYSMRSIAFRLHIHGALW